MHTRQSTPDGKFSFTLFCGCQELETVGGFANHFDADHAAAKAERNLMLCGYDADLYMDMFSNVYEFQLSVDDLMSELTE